MIVTAAIYENMGESFDSPRTFTLTGRVVKTGEISWEVDEGEGTFRVKPGDMSCEIEDFDDALWTYLGSLPNAEGFLPPWLLVSAHGVPVFLGLISPDRCRRVKSDRVVEVWAADWSTQFGEKVLTGADWQRVPPKSLGNAVPEVTRTVYTSVLLWIGDAGDVADNAVFVEAPCPFYVGDRLTSPNLAGSFRVTSVAASTRDPSWVMVTLNNWRWSAASWFQAIPPGHPTQTMRAANLLRPATDVEQVGYWELAEATVANSEHPVHVLKMKGTVNGLIAGDEIRTVDPVVNQTYTVADVDSLANEIITKEEVQSHPKDTRFYWTDDSASTMVLQDARTLITNAAAGICRVDFSQFHPADMPSPVLSWLPLQPIDGDALVGPTRVEALGGALRVFLGQDAAVTGTPEIGWERTANLTKYADWTCQQLQQPSSLMPDETDTVVAGLGGTGYYRWGVWIPGAPTGSVHHDYSTGTRHLVQASSKTWREWAWNGATYDAYTTRSWPGGKGVSQIVAWPGRPGVYVGVTDDGRVEMTTGEWCSLPPEASKAVLCRTPWAVYLVGGRGYGWVVWRPTREPGGTLAVIWQDVVAEGDGQLHPSTFAAVDQDVVFVMASLTVPDPGDQGKLMTATAGIQLKAYPNPLNPSLDEVLVSEIMMEGAPRRFSVVRDPSRPGRVIGQCGGALFQVSRDLPSTVHRIQADGMTALDMIEAVCSFHNALAVPAPDGVLYIVSRMVAGSPVAISPNVVQNAETLAGQWYSWVVIGGGDDNDPVYEAQGQAGGRTLTITNHPCTTTESGKRAMAQQLVQWFGVRRRRYEVQVFHEDHTIPAPWQSFARWQLVAFPGMPECRVGRLKMDPITGTATLGLVEAEGGAYGYGAF